MGITIKDAPLVEQLSGEEKIPISDGSNEPRTVNVEQIKEFSNKGIEMPRKVSELENDSGYATSKEVEESISKIPAPDVSGQIKEHNQDESAHPFIQNKIAKVVSEALADYVKKEVGKSLSSNDFTNELKAKLESLTPYDPSELEEEVGKLKTTLNTLVSGNASNAIESFNEIVAFLNSVSDKETLGGIIAGINTRVAEVEAKIPTKVSELENDKNYLTEHQDISHLVTHDDIQGMEEAVEQAKSVSTEAKIMAEQASIDATIAKNAVTTLEGLANADEAMQTLAGQVVQIEKNKQKLSELGSRLPVVNEDGFFVTDKLNNVGLQYTKDGLDAALLSLHFIKLLKDAGIGSGNIGNEVVEDGFFFVDEALNIGVAIDNEGIHAKNILEYEVVDV